MHPGLQKSDVIQIFWYYERKRRMLVHVITPEICSTGLRNHRVLTSASGVESQVWMCKTAHVTG